jgi:N-acyl-D-amino-acid deacylase
VEESEAARRLQPGTAIYFLMDEGGRPSASWRSNETMVGSDGIPVGDKPHPRFVGTFPRVLGHYSRDVALFPAGDGRVEDDGLTARNFRPGRRGTIAVGAACGPVVFRCWRPSAMRRPTRIRRGRRGHPCVWS